MQKKVIISFAILGALFCVILLVIVLFFGMRPGYTPVPVTNVSQTDEQTDAQTVDSTNPAISENQTKALNAFGIDPAMVTSITPAQEACFTAALGAARVAEIKAGATPNAADFFKAQQCL